MSLNFSTIGIYGLISIIIIGGVILSGLAVVFRTVRNLKINTSKFSIESSQRIEQLEKKTTTSFENQRLVLNKQKKLADHHIMNMAGDFRKLFADQFELTNEQKNTIWILVYAMLLNLSNMIFENFSENHIGETDNEIEIYSRIRTSEYTNYIKTFFDDYDWVIPNVRLRSVIHLLPPDYLFSKLYIIYKDGKRIEN